MLFALPLEKRVKHSSVVHENLVQVVEDLPNEALEPLLRDRGCVQQRVNKYIADQFQIADIVALGLDYLEEHRLSLDFLFIEHHACLWWDKPMPFFVVLGQIACLKATKGLFRVDAG